MLCGPTMPRTCWPPPPGPGQATHVFDRVGGSGQGPWSCPLSVPVSRQRLPGQRLGAPRTPARVALYLSHELSRHIPSPLCRRTGPSAPVQQASARTLGAPQALPTRPPPSPQRGAPERAGSAPWPPRPSHVTPGPARSREPAGPFPGAAWRHSPPLSVLPPLPARPAGRATCCVIALCAPTPPPTPGCGLPAPPAHLGGGRRPWCQRIFRAVVIYYRLFRS